MYLIFQNGLFSETYPLIYSNPWSFYMRIRYMRAYFWSTYLSNITRSNCIFFLKITTQIIHLKVIDIIDTWIIDHKYKACHKFKLTKRDDYFWVTLNPFGDDQHF